MEPVLIVIDIPKPIITAAADATAVNHTWTNFERVIFMRSSVHDREPATCADRDTADRQSRAGDCPRVTSGHFVGGPAASTSLRVRLSHFAQGRRVNAGTLDALRNQSRK